MDTRVKLGHCAGGGGVPASRRITATRCGSSRRRPTKPPCASWRRAGEPVVTLRSRIWAVEAHALVDANASPRRKRRATRRPRRRGCCPLRRRACVGLASVGRGIDPGLRGDARLRERILALEVRVAHPVAAAGEECRRAAAGDAARTRRCLGESREVSGNLAVIDRRVVAGGGAGIAGIPDSHRGAFRVHGARLVVVRRGNQPNAAVCTRRGAGCLGGHVGRGIDRHLRRAVRGVLVRAAAAAGSGRKHRDVYTTAIAVCMAESWHRPRDGRDLPPGRLRKTLARPALGMTAATIAYAGRDGQSPGDPRIERRGDRRSRRSTTGGMDSTGSTRRSAPRRSGGVDEHGKSRAAPTSTSV